MSEIPCCATKAKFPRMSKIVEFLGFPTSLGPPLQFDQNHTSRSGNLKDFSKFMRISTIFRPWPNPELALGIWTSGPGYTSGARSAPGKFWEVLYSKYKGNTNKTRRAKRAANFLWGILLKIQRKYEYTRRAKRAGENFWGMLLKIRRKCE